MEHAQPLILLADHIAIGVSVAAIVIAVVVAISAVGGRSRCRGSYCCGTHRSSIRISATVRDATTIGHTTACDSSTAIGHAAACNRPATNTYRTGTGATGSGATTSERFIRYQRRAHEGSGRKS
jgi:hypothetical protein